MPLKVATTSAKQKFTSDVTELSFSTAEPFSFEAGQFVTIKIADKVPPCFRAYSICTCPSDAANCFGTCLKIVENGRGSNWLGNLNIGDKIEFLGPSGKFTFQGKKENSLFIATGTGITPFKAMISDQLKKGRKQKLHLLFGLRHFQNIFYQDLFEDLAGKNPNFTYDITLTKPENDQWKGKIGRVTEILKTMQLDNTEVYICGLKAMIDEVVTILKEKGLAPEDIHFEKYD